MIRRPFVVFSLLALACSTASTELGRSENAIQGGTTDSTHTYAVGISIDGSGICSGSLIAPNLVLTARHCVSDLSTGELITAQSRFINTRSAASFRVYTVTQMPQGNGCNTGCKSVRQVVVPSNTLAQGNDIALLILNANIPANEAVPVTPAVQHAVFNTRRYINVTTAIGYGKDGPTNDASAGTRRIRQLMSIVCLDGSQAPGSCDKVTDTNGVRQVMTTEFLTSDGVCQGDSGSGAFDQKTFNEGSPHVLGTLSRGPEGSCELGIYTRTDSHKDLIIATGKQAASLGGYTAPAWTQAVAPDPEDTPYTPGADGGKKDTGTTKAGLGESCSTNTDCDTALCKDNACTQACSDSSPCPDGFSCAADVCIAAPGSTSGNAAQGETTTTTTTGCSMVTDPTKPIPWRVPVGLFVVVGLLAARRRRA